MTTNETTRPPDSAEVSETERIVLERLRSIDAGEVGVAAADVIAEARVVSARD